VGGDYDKCDGRSSEYMVFGEKLEEKRSLGRPTRK